MVYNNFLAVADYVEMGVAFSGVKVNAFCIVWNVSKCDRVEVDIRSLEPRKTLRLPVPALHLVKCLLVNDG